MLPKRLSRPLALVIALLLVVSIGLVLAPAPEAQGANGPARVMPDGPAIRRLVDRETGVVCYIINQPGFVACVNIGRDVARDVPVTLSPR